jgi:hypothetical protein
MRKEIKPLYVPPQEMNFDPTKFENEEIDSIVPVNALQAGNAEDFDGFSYAVTEGSDPLDSEEMEAKTGPTLESVAELDPSALPLESVDNVEAILMKKNTVTQPPKASEARKTRH